MEAGSQGNRIWVIDIARFYAIALVFYGHFIERIMYLQNPTAAAHYKFIYSFHMVLFFVLAGYVSKTSVLELSFGKFLKHRFFSRLLPYIFFTGFMIVLTFFFPGDFFQLKLPSIDGYLKGLLLTVFGLPNFNVPTWFLLMLFSVELIHYCVFRFLKSDSKILIAAVLFYVVGYVLNRNIEFVNPMKNRVVGWNYFFIHEAITMYGFYLLGVYLRHKKFLMEKVSPQILVPGVIITFLIVLFTYELNKGPFMFFNSVVIMMASHGNFFWFPLTAVVGGFFILFLAKITPAQKTIVWMGQNTLILMAMNGIFYHFINPPTAKWVLENLPGTALSIFGVGCGMTIASLICCIPLIFFFNKFIPQLVGKPKITGPLLKNLI